MTAALPSRPRAIWTEPSPIALALSNLIRNTLTPTTTRHFKGIKGDVVGAIADINRAIELDPKLAAAYYNRAYTKQGKGDIDGAIADYTRAIELQPDSAAAYYNRGGARRSKDDFDGAIADFDRVIKLKPKEAVAYAFRSEVEAKKRQTAGSRTEKKLSN